MKSLIPWIVISGLLFTAFVIALYFSIKKKIRSNIFLCILTFILFISIAIYTAVLIGHKSYRFVNQNIHNPFSDRKGIDIYVALFGRPTENCVFVTNKTDQIIPRLDCCIWLEFITCPKELNRILLFGDYKNVEFTNNNIFVPDYSPRPEWFKPQLLGDTIVELEIFKPDNPNRHQLIYFNRDSTHAFYCDMAD
jgi:hypothetical protein